MNVKIKVGFSLVMCFMIQCSYSQVKVADSDKRSGSVESSKTHQFESQLPAGKKWNLVWHDEFEGNSIDTNKWNFRLNYWGYKSPTFTKEGVQLDGDGHLRISLIRKGDNFYSGHLQTGSLTFDIPRDQGVKGFWPFGPRKAGTRSVQSRST